MKNRDVERSIIYDLEYVRQFLVKAQADLGDAKCLYQCKGYSNTAFLLQQSIEKGEKTIDLSLGMVKITNTTEDNVGKNKHRSSLVVKDIHNSAMVKFNTEMDTDHFFRFMITTIRSRFFEDYPQLNKVFNVDESDWKVIDEISKDIKLTSDELSGYIDFLINANATLLKYKKDPFLVLTEDQINQYVDDMIDYLYEHSEDNEDIVNRSKREFKRWVRRETFKKIDEKAFHPFILGCINFMQADFILSGLSIITEAHATARYPKEGFIPTEFYNEDTPIIAKFDKIYDLTDEALKSLDVFVTRDIFIITTPIFTFLKA